MNNIKKIIYLTTSVLLCGGLSNSWGISPEIKAEWEKRIEQQKKDLNVKSLTGYLRSYLVQGSEKDSIYKQLVELYEQAIKKQKDSLLPKEPKKPTPMRRQINEGYPTTQYENIINNKPIEHTQKNPQQEEESQKPVLVMDQEQLKEETKKFCEYLYNTFQNLKIKLKLKYAPSDLCINAVFLQNGEIKYEEICQIQENETTFTELFEKYETQFQLVANTMGFEKLKNIIADIFNDSTDENNMSKKIYIYNYAIDAFNKIANAIYSKTGLVLTCKYYNHPIAASSMKFSKYVLNVNKIFVPNNQEYLDEDYYLESTSIPKKINNRLYEINPTSAAFEKYVSNVQNYIDKLKEEAIFLGAQGINGIRTAYSYIEIMQKLFKNNAYLQHKYIQNMKEENISPLRNPLVSVK